MPGKEPVHTGDEVRTRLKALPRWRADEGWLIRTFQTDGWPSTMLVVGAIAFVAEAANHHPDLAVSWPCVVVKLQTHSAGGLTDKDFELAAQIEQAVTWRPTGPWPGLEGNPKRFVK
ncbi:MAG: 4a-hydroxytetrahydrobiopterin dehydratase [Gemmatimonadales bacterium]